MSYRTRKLLCILVLVIGLPLYIALAAVIIGWFDRPVFLLELGIYIALGVVWALPLRALFRGMGRAGPGQQEPPRVR